MSDLRYVIALRSEFDFADPVLDLPDVEHIHLTRLPDGRWTAVAMEPLGVSRGGGANPMGLWPVHPLLRGDRLAWVDVPAEPEKPMMTGHWPARPGEATHCLTDDPLPAEPEDGARD